jgi:hypothetical protein
LVHARYREHGKDVEIAGLVPQLVALPAEVLPIRARGAGADAAFCIGPLPVRTREKLARELARVALDPSAQVHWPDGTRKRVPVVIEAQPGARVADVLTVWDEAVAAGFADVACSVLEAWARAQLPPRVPPSPDRDGKR